MKLLFLVAVRKASFESFMKQITGIRDPSGEFLMPDGTTAEMGKARTQDIKDTRPASEWQDVASNMEHSEHLEHGKYP